MTVNEFIQTLHDLKMVRWYLKNKVAIRTMIDGVELDPLSLVAFHRGGSFTFNWHSGNFHQPHIFNYFWNIGRVLDLPEVAVHRIFRASDNHVLESAEDTRMRILLLEACRFKVKPLEILLECQNRVEPRNKLHNQLKWDNKNK